MSGPLEKLLERVDETIDIISNEKHYADNRKVTGEEIASALKKSIDIIEKKSDEKPLNLGLRYIRNRLEGFRDGIQYMTDITLDKWYCLQPYLKAQITVLKREKL
ncbi:MAG: hypothetical protein NTW30_00745 [Candidatus Aenigmarchaeota archaeon]|nr:hypothetical protein [Candidatus Aenigmarchaeota archaeon]